MHSVIQYSLWWSMYLLIRVRTSVHHNLTVSCLPFFVFFFPPSVPNSQNKCWLQVHLWQEWLFISHSSPQCRPLTSNLSPGLSIWWFYFQQVNHGLQSYSSLEPKTCNFGGENVRTDSSRGFTDEHLGLRKRKKKKKSPCVVWTLPVWSHSVPFSSHSEALGNLLPTKCWVLKQCGVRAIVVCSNGWFLRGLRWDTPLRAFINPELSVIDTYRLPYTIRARVRQRISCSLFLKLLERIGPIVLISSKKH